MDNVTLFSAFEQLLVELGATQLILKQYATFYKFLYNIIKLMIGVFTIINTVFVFTDQNAVIRQVFQVLNLVFAAGLLGDFGKKEARTKEQIAKMEFVSKSLLTTMRNLGVAVVPQPAIIDMAFSAPTEMRALNVEPPRRYEHDLSDLVPKGVLRMKLLQLQTMIRA